jgi:hypothetical protein
MAEVYVARLPEARSTVTTWADPFTLCLVIIATYVTLSPFNISTATLSLLIVAISSAVMALLEWWRAPRAVARPYREVSSHVWTAWLGTLVGLSIVVLAWYSLSEYRLAHYVPFFKMLPIMLLLAPFLCFFGILLGDRRFGVSSSGGFQLGLLARGRLSEVNWALLRDDLLSWFIRGFFLPLNFSTLVSSINGFRGKEYIFFNGNWAHNEYFLLAGVYALIIAAVTPGYLFGARLFRTDTKAVAASFFAWTVTLACYPPFWSATLRWFSYYGYTPNPAWMQPWVHALQNAPLLLAVVGVVIFLSSLIHLWGEAQFGIRSSNLTNRGIITVGPYRFSKHPVYVAKCIAWFFIWMPFFAGGGLLNDLRLTVLFAGVVGIFMLRAIAEEKMLAADPIYVAYALWIDEHGLFRKVGQLIPPMSFRWRLEYWMRKGYEISPITLDSPLIERSAVF